MWSPDGRTILFLDGHDSAQGQQDGLATMRPDGSARRFVSQTPQVEHQPDWESIPGDDRGEHEHERGS